MPGPEAAGATPPPPPAPTPAADVIDLQQRRALAHAQRQDATVTAEPEPPEAPGLLPMAVHAEALFSDHGMTLTHQPTAEAFRVALDLAVGIVDGALAQQHITEDAHQRLQGTLLTARRAPDAL